MGRACKSRVNGKKGQSFNGTVGCIKNIILTSTGIDIGYAEYTSMFGSKVIFPGNSSYIVNTGNTIIITGENILGRTVDINEEENCVYKSTGIKICRKNKHSQFWDYYNKSGELCDDIYNFKSGDVIYQDLSCLFGYEKIISN